MRGRGVEESPQLPPYFFMTVPFSLKTIGLFEWEAPILKANAKKLSLSLRIKPDAIIWDQNSKKAIVTMWNLDHDNCPFLSEDNKCRIYKDRPLVCQSYPLMTIGILARAHKDVNKMREIGLGDCPNVVKLLFFDGKPFQARFSTVFNKLFEVYGKTFLGALRYDGAVMLLSEYTQNALNQGIVRPAIIKKNVIKAILRSKPIGLFQFLRSKGEINRKELQKEIQGIYDVTMETLKQIMNGRYTE